MPFPYGFPFQLGEGTVIANEALTTETARLAQYIRGKPNMEAILDAQAQLHGERIDTLASMVINRYLANAFGAQLDVIGDILGEVRMSADDDEYRQRLQARSLLNRSSGGIEEIISILDLIETSDCTYEYKYEGPAVFRIRVVNTELDNGSIAAELAALLLRFLRLSKAAGVRAQLDTFEAETDAAEFRFDGDGGSTFDDSDFVFRIVRE